MSDQPDITEFSLTERVVLLGIADAAAADETPVASWEVRERIERVIRFVDTETVSTPTEAEAAGALNTLATDPAIGEHQSGSSPTGKGRPRYDLAVELEAVLDALAADDRLDPAVETVRE